MRVAVLVDAAFFLTRYKQIVAGGRSHDGKQVAEALHRWACDHMQFDGAGRSRVPVDLYRIFVYDCPPYTGRLENPISRRQVDFAKTELAAFRSAFHSRLPQLRKVALRLGHLSEVRNWTIKPSAMDDIIRRRRTAESLTDDDVILDVKQKGVDMRIGVDVASLAYKKLVDRIVLVAGDADFVPAAKLARREGIDFVLDSMHAHINESLYEHIDGLVSMAPEPSRRGANPQPAKHYSLSFSLPYAASPSGMPSKHTTQGGLSGLADPALLDAIRRNAALAAELAAKAVAKQDKTSASTPGAEQSSPSTGTAGDAGEGAFAKDAPKA